ncbi:MAG: GNAT family N-acetyltransferase [Eudoraea sp.]|nr:GNAT family N-acetyltransferase [Eudoraea sp.]MBT8294373.1 GNAT family N-acetyltransferase [Eudoraea sp.]NNL00823.1 GNAT family N-acetyltransferase [Eudoraea sp.]
MRSREVKLRALQVYDKSQLAKLANNRKIWDNLRDSFPNPYSESDAELFINLTTEENPKQNFAIEYGGDLCGVIGLIIQNDVYRKSAEIGYWIGEPFWGKGITANAIKLITNYGFEDLKLIRIYAGVFEYNIASMKALENSGYKKEGVFKKAIYKNDKVFDEHRYFKLKEF